MLLSISSAIRRTPLARSPIFSPLNSYNFFFSKSKSDTDHYNFDPKLKEDLLHEPKFAHALKIIQTFPLDIGRDSHSESKSDQINIFNKSTYLRIMASEEFKDWESFFNLYYKALEEKNPSLLRGKTEINLVRRLEQFFRDISGLGLHLEIIRPEKPQTILSIATHKTIEGVFIDRILNLHSSEYFMKLGKDKATYEPIKHKKPGDNLPPKLPKFDQKELVDQDIELNYLEKDRSKMSINQYFIEVETNLRVVLSKKEGGKNKIIYGSDEPGWETHYMLIENRRDVFKKYPYYLTDFDFVLDKNPHIYGRK